MDEPVRRTRRRSNCTRLSRKHQATIPTAVLREAGLEAGTMLRVRVLSPGRIVLERADSPIDAVSGAYPDVFPPEFLDRLRDEWPR
jgi:bifunctional DNA-binding transcriptional regulator/antitoxin component of YhaV-PrlF toxin-antitoxin module